ncbi:MAG: hypothetical protein A2161_01490 [Candidatus Schekmanbacteria bacterium RBG_13_48_7]|uniref:Uncharacterized protein n=1 Tax=Candidatus Schekmanbacteria bacterium RBG_13_48_7 TaxID=1817878 RepID=A0A1F7RUN1_9BACT|nr:MAG: hypothetical protein A2161_01490 [Candidatus Schekmanbacteria bacterium RBG_13_48_7]
MFWKQQLPLMFCFIFGVFALVAYFSPVLDDLNHEYIVNWNLIIFGFSMALGIYSLLSSHFRKVFRQSKGWVYNLVALIGYFAMVFLGFAFGISESSTFQYLFLTIQVPVQATMFSILAFYIASASFRAFRARTLEATLLLLAAIIVMLGQVPLGSQNIPFITELKNWIMNVPNLAAKRGIWIGVGLGIISTALKIILGIERTYLGGAGSSK